MRRALSPLLVLVAALLAAFALAACGDSGESGDTSGDAQTVATTAAQDASPCTAVELPAPKADAAAPKPKRPLAAGRSWEAVVTTNCGTFTIALDTGGNPKTSASFASLARKGFYDDTTFHRIVPGWVIQGGDPLGSGSGGPGYSVVEAPAKNTAYTRGVVAMAKTATEPDGTSGSQFFVVMADDAQLPPQYAVLGRVTEGLDVIDTIGATPLQSNDPQGSAPVDPVVIESVEIRES